MNTRKAILELIDILEGACTQYATEEGFGHEHNMFDNVDQDRLDDLKAALSKPAGVEVQDVDN